MNAIQVNEKLDILKNVSQAMYYENLQKKYYIVVGLLITMFVIILTSMFFEKWDFFIAGFIAYVGIQIEVIKTEKLKSQLVSNYIEKHRLANLKDDAQTIVKYLKQFISKKENGFNQEDKVFKMLMENKLSGLDSEIGAIIYLFSENKDKSEVSAE